MGDEKVKPWWNKALSYSGLKRLIEGMELRDGIKELQGHGTNLHPQVVCKVYGPDGTEMETEWAIAWEENVDGKAALHVGILAK